METFPERNGDGAESFHLALKADMGATDRNELSQ